MNLSTIFKALVLIAAGSVSVAAQDAYRSISTILADLRTNNLSAEEILGVDSPESVAIVSLEDFEGADLQRLEETLGGTEDGYGEVQTAIERNEALEIAVRDMDLDLLDVIAVTRSGADTYTIYTDLPRR